MSTWVNVVGNESRMANKVRVTVDEVRRCRDDVAALKGIVDEIAAGPDWAALAAALGFEAGAQGEADAQAIYNNLTNVHAVLQGSDVRYLVNRLG